MSPHRHKNKELLRASCKKEGFLIDAIHEASKAYKNDEFLQASSKKQAQGMQGEHVIYLEKLSLFTLKKKSDRFPARAVDCSSPWDVY